LFASIYVVIYTLLSIRSFIYPSDIQKPLDPRSKPIQNVVRGWFVTYPAVWHNCSSPIARYLQDWQV